MNNNDSLQADDPLELERLRQRVRDLEQQLEEQLTARAVDQRQLEELVKERTAELEETGRRLRRQTADLAVALRRQNLLAKAVEAVREGVAITDADFMDDGPKLLFVNDYFLEMSGYGVAELVGARLHLIYAPGRNRGIWREIRRRLSDRQPFTGILVCRRREGEEYLALTHMSPVFDNRGRLTHVVSIQQDVTEKRNQEQRLLRSEQRYRLLIEQMNEGFITTSADNRIDLANAKFASMLGYDQEELQGVELGKFVHPTHHERLGRQNLKRRQGKAEPYELSWLAKDGRRIETVISPTSLLDDNGKFVGSFAVITDTTERRRLEERIQKAQKLESLGLLAGGVAHDFNNLLVGMMGHAGLALMELERDSPVRPLVRQIETAALRASELTKEMLAYSGRGKFVTEAVHLSELVVEIATLLRVTIGKKIELEFDIAESLPSFEGDPTQLRQIVMNLLTNASEAIGDRSGSILVRTGEMFADRDYLASTFMDDELAAQEYVYFEVVDSGSGMDAETRSKIFDPFFTTKFTGRGLGLAAVLGIVRGHQGAIQVESEPQTGTTIRVLFPGGGGPAVQASFDAESEDSTAVRGSGTVLVVDDEEMVRGVARMSLETAGYGVLSAEDGAEALEIFAASHGQIDAVLLDLTMPRMGGEETLEGILRLRSDAKVILTSGFSEPEGTLQKSAAGFLQKPFQPQELVSMLREVLRQ